MLLCPDGELRVLAQCTFASVYICRNPLAQTAYSSFMHAHDDDDDDDDEDADADDDDGDDDDDDDFCMDEQLSNNRKIDSCRSSRSSPKATSALTVWCVQRRMATGSSTGWSLKSMSISSAASCALAICIK